MEKLRLWCSFHPSQVSKEVFRNQVLAIKDAGIVCSVGAVASVTDYDTLQWLRTHLPPDIYFWLNANERDKKPTSDEINAQFQLLDPLYNLETSLWPANVEFCLGGKKSVFMNADGDLFACNISKIKIGNLYQQQCSSPACMARQCHCYLAYHLRHDIPALSQLGAERCFRIFPL